MPRFFRNKKLNLPHLDNGTEARLGAYVGAKLARPLNADRTWLIEAGASYRWVDEIETSVGNAAVNIDLSSMEGRIGLVRQF